jgi:hypothetical protein
MRERQRETELALEKEVQSQQQQQQQQSQPSPLPQHQKPQQENATDKKEYSKLPELPPQGTSETKPTTKEDRVEAMRRAYGAPPPTAPVKVKRKSTIQGSNERVDPEKNTL